MIIGRATRKSESARPDTCCRVQRIGKLTIMHSVFVKVQSMLYLQLECLVRSERTIHLIIQGMALSVTVVVIYQHRFVIKNF